MKKTSLIIFSLICSLSFSQVGINTSTPHPSAILDITSTNKALLLPRVVNVAAVTAPTDGMLVYDLSTNCIKFYENNTWSDCLISSNNNSNTTLAQIGFEADNPDIVKSIVTIAQLNTITGITGVVSQYQMVYQNYIDSNPNLFSSPATIAEIQAMVTFFNNALPAVPGGSLTSFSNGSENFSNNATCIAKLISTNQTPATCSGNVVVGSNTYPVVLINGQCWMQTNLKESPTNPCAASPNTGCNVWLNTTTTNANGWGYYNTTNTTGSAGWGTSEPAAGEGLSYQWNAAMNGSTIERAKGVCPTGWHIPSDCEWMYLEHGQGMSITKQNSDSTISTRFTTGEGSKLSSSGSNSSGFSLLRPGLRFPSGFFSERGTRVLLITSTEKTSTTFVGRYIDSTINGGQPIYRPTNSVKNHLSASIRCLKD